MGLELVVKGEQKFNHMKSGGGVFPAEGIACAKAQRNFQKGMLIHSQCISHSV